MSVDDPRREAVAVVASLRGGTARGVLRAFIRGRHEEAVRLLWRCGYADIEDQLADPVFYEWLLEALDQRISPPDPDGGADTEPDSIDTEPYDLRDPDTDESRPE